jgi:hypothetical protein
MMATKAPERTVYFACRSSTNIVGSNVLGVPSPMAEMFEVVPKSVIVERLSNLIDEERLP